MDSAIHLLNKARKGPGRLCSKHHFECERFWNSEMAYWLFYDGRLTQPGKAGAEDDSADFAITKPRLKQTNFASSLAPCYIKVLLYTARYFFTHNPK